MRSGVAVLVAVAVFVAAGCGGGGPIGAKRLAKQAEAVQSLAAEGALLAEDSADGRSTRVFRREHSSDLTKAASTVAAALGKGKAEPALEPELRRLVVIAGRVRAELARLGDASTGEQREIGRRLEGAAKESEQLGEGLG